MPIYPLPNDPKRQHADSSQTMLMSAESQLLALLSCDAALEEYAELIARAQREVMPDGERERIRAQVGQALAIRERLELHQQRERGLLAVIESAQDLTALRDVDRVLAAIVHRARALVASDVGYLSIFDATAGDFYVRATDGAFSEQFKRIRVPGDIGICGHVARTRAPYSSSNYVEDGRFSHTYGIDSGVIDESIRSILGVPLLIGERVLGVLFVGDRYTRPYSPWEVSILTTLASHASVVIENARLFAEHQEALAHTSAANDRLQRQAEDTQFAADAHEKLTALVARGGSLQDIAAMVSQLLGGEVIVLDEGEQPVSWSGEARARDATGHAWQDSIHQALFDSRVQGRSVVAFANEQGLCRVSAITSGSGLLGGLAITTPAALTHLETRSFERAALVTGMLLLSQERARYTSGRDSSALLRVVLDGRQEMDAAMLDRFSRQGVDMRRPVSLVCCVPTHGDAQYLVKRLRTAFAAEGTLFDEYEGRVVLLGTGSDAEQLGAKVHECITGRLGLSATCVSAAPAQAAALPQVMASVVRCLTLLNNLGRLGTHAQEAQLALYARLFERQSAQDIAAFVEATLGKLRASDRKRRGELCATLLTYLDVGRNARLTAATLDIHVNTLRQRLEAIDILLGDWQSTGRGLDIHMALRLDRLLESS